MALEGMVLMVVEALATVVAAMEGFHQDLLTFNQVATTTLILITITKVIEAML